MTFQDFQDFLERDFQIGDFYLSLSHLLLAALVIVGARLLMWLISNVLVRFFRRRKIDAGRRLAYLQFIKYVVYTAATLMALTALGVQISVIWGGAAALLVGVGLGLQQTFNDLISGLILLIEGTVDVGDIVEINGVVGTVVDIGIRTSKIKSRDGIALLIPNSKLVSDSSTNWSHTVHTTRFQIKVGVGYTSDVQLVTQLLLEAAQTHADVLETPEPRVQFKDFGDSSLDFQLHFYSNELLKIEFVKSDIRYKIMQLFRDNNIEIPFPQQDIWLRNYKQ